MSKIRILSRSAQPFQDRREAGRLLGAELGEYASRRPVVLGIPRGGVVVASEIAESLDGELDIVLARKLRTPGHLELAMGSVGEGGEVFLNEPLVRELGIDRSHIEREKEGQLAEIARRSAYIRREVPRIPLAQRTVIATDDGIATGATMQAAVWAVRQERPHELVVALPVAAQEAVDRLVGIVDQIVCLRMPLFFAAVGQFYVRFDQTTDEQVLQTLKESRVRTHSRS